MKEAVVFACELCYNFIYFCIGRIAAIFERQNHKEALTYLKAWAYCDKKERIVTYVMVTISVFICLAGIFNRYLFFFVPNNPKTLQAQELFSQILNIVSGVFILSQIFINTQLRKIHRTAVNLIERYDCYVYDMSTNNAMLANISRTDIEAYARKVKHTKKYLNFYFATPEAAADKFGVFDNQYRIIKDEYVLMSYVKPFFLTIWIGFVVIILGLAMSFDDKFVSTLINTLIPSLSILSLILSSSHLFNEAAARLQKTISLMDLQRDGCKKSWSNDDVRQYLAKIQRGNQDGLFYIRGLSFTIPVFLKKRLDKLLKVEEKGRSQIPDSKNNKSLSLAQSAAKPAKDSQTDLTQKQPKPAQKQPKQAQQEKPKPIKTEKPSVEKKPAKTHAVEGKAEKPMAKSAESKKPQKADSAEAMQQNPPKKAAKTTKSVKAEATVPVAEGKPLGTKAATKKPKDSAKQQQ